MSYKIRHFCNGLGITTSSQGKNCDDCIYHLPPSSEQQTTIIWRVMFSCRLTHLLLIYFILILMICLRVAKASSAFRRADNYVIKDKKRS